MLLGPSIFSCFPDVKTRKSSVTLFHAVSFCKGHGPTCNCCSQLRKGLALRLPLGVGPTKSWKIQVNPKVSYIVYIGIPWSHRIFILSSFYHRNGDVQVPHATVFCLFFQSYGYNPCILAHPEMVLMPTIFWWFSSYETPAKCNSRWLFQFECGIPYTVYCILLHTQICCHWIVGKMMINHGFRDTLLVNMSHGV